MHGTSDWSLPFWLSLRNSPFFVMLPSWFPHSLTSRSSPCVKTVVVAISFLVFVFSQFLCCHAQLLSFFLLFWYLKLRPHSVVYFVLYALPHLMLHPCRCAITTLREPSWHRNAEKQTSKEPRIRHVAPQTVVEREEVRAAQATETSQQQSKRQQCQSRAITNGWLSGISTRCRRQVF